MRVNFLKRRPQIWERKEFWLAAFVLVVPFGWLILLARIEPVRIALRSVGRAWI